MVKMSDLKEEYREVLSAAETAAEEWDGNDVAAILHPLRMVQRVYKRLMEIDEAALVDDYDNELLDILEEKSVWPNEFQETNREFAVAADAQGRYVSWEFAPDLDWKKSPLFVGRFSTPE